MAAIRSWGVRWSPAFAHSELGHCPECGWSGHYIGDSSDRYMEHLVGYDSGVHGGHNKGAFIFECPKCFEKFWHHAYGRQVEYLHKNNSAWPK